VIPGALVPPADDGSTGILIALITVGVPLVGAAVGWLVKHLLGVTRKLDEVKSQVSNDHGSNLREDLDFIRDVLLETRSDVAWMRREQLDQARRITYLEAS